MYLPQDMLEQHGAARDTLAAATAPPALRAVLRDLAQRNAALVAHGAELSGQVRDWRLCLETAIIARLARTLNALVLARDPLGERVHLSKTQGLFEALIGAGSGIGGRFRRAAAPRASSGLA